MYMFRVEATISIQFIHMFIHLVSLTFAIQRKQCVLIYTDTEMVLDIFLMTKCDILYWRVLFTRAKVFFFFKYVALKNLMRCLIHQLQEGVRHLQVVKCLYKIALVKLRILLRMFKIKVTILLKPVLVGVDGSLFVNKLN